MFLLYFLIMYSLTGLISCSTLADVTSERSVPSVVILGTAKGGTTDLWYYLMNHHEMFSRIGALPRKELDFPMICKSFEKNSNEACKADEIQTLLLCPRNVIYPSIDFQRADCSKKSIDCDLSPSFQIENPLLRYTRQEKQALLSKCSASQNRTLSRPIQYTIDATPGFLNRYSETSYYLQKLNKHAHNIPLFICLLRNPVTRTISLYNHWYVQRHASRDHQYLTLNDQLELELAILQLPHHLKLIEKANNVVMSRDSLNKTSEALQAYVTLCANMKRC